MIQHLTRRNLETPLRVLVYSNNADTRDRIKLALGMSPSTRLTAADFIDVATPAVALRHVRSGNVDVAILDGEASPAGD
ncbi:response regulator [Mycobacterium xenopi 4042]|uniref:Response regulator n=1 Tax=Mycobacterium xenopi 4042 TaxID=1299334 RepID=X7ZW32_MYCXE|nr:response regulator [Mycobacterium xenopi 4042]